MKFITDYFNAEKYESFIFLIAGIIATLFAAYFIFFQKESFYKGMAIPLIVVALLQIVVGYTVLIRSPKDIFRVEQIIKTEKSKIETEEIPRMKVVMKNFVIYRYIELALLLAGIICMFCFNQNSFMKGIGVGLFIQSALMLSFDFFAEKRGQEYLTYLLQTWI